MSWQIRQEQQRKTGRPQNDFFFKKRYRDAATGREGNQLTIIMRRAGIVQVCCQHNINLPFIKSPIWRPPVLTVLSTPCGGPQRPLRGGSRWAQVSWAPHHNHLNRTIHLIHTCSSPSICLLLLLTTAQECLTAGWIKAATVCVCVCVQECVSAPSKREKKIPSPRGVSIYTTHTYTPLHVHLCHLAYNYLRLTHTSTSVMDVPCATQCWHLTAKTYTHINYICHISCGPTLMFVWLVSVVFMFQLWIQHVLASGWWN